MKKSLCLKIFYLPFLLFTLAGCTPTKNVIPPLRHNEDVGIHIAKTAYLHWIPGRQVASEKAMSTSTSYSANGQNNNGLAGLITSMMASAIENQYRKNRPSEYLYEYSKADEAVFITSLRDTLIQQSVFKNVELVTDTSKVSAKDVLIEIYFKTARVVDFEDIKLTVSLTIKSGNRPPYEKTYLTLNDPPETSKTKKFIEKKTEVSQKILTMIIDGIKKWHEENK